MWIVTCINLCWLDVWKLFSSGLRDASGFHCIFIYIYISLYIWLKCRFGGWCEPPILLGMRHHLREFGHPVAQGLAAIVLRGECPASGERPWRILALQRMTRLGSWFGEESHSYVFIWSATRSMWDGEFFLKRTDLRLSLLVLWTSLTAAADIFLSLFSSCR